MGQQINRYITKIDKGIKLPSKSRIVKSKFPFDNMNIGDSFYVDLTGYKKSAFGSRGNAICWNGWLRASLRKLKRKFAYRMEKNGVRVWRIK